MRKLFLIVATVLLSLGAHAEDKSNDYVLGAGDMVRITVYGSPDLTTETRVSAAGTLTFPLLGEVVVGGMAAGVAEKKIATSLEEGGFVKQPQVNLVVLQFQSQLVSVLGNVNKPGRYPLDRPSTLTDVLATAGGIAMGGADTIVVSIMHDGKVDKREIDVDQLYRSGGTAADIKLRGGDMIYVPRQPLFYIYGEVQRPGSFRLESRMSVAQALAVGGGLTVRGTERGIRIKRRDANGVIQTIEPKASDVLQADDVIYVSESLY